GCRGDRVAAWGRVPVLGGEAYVDVLAGPVPGPVGDVEAHGDGLGRLRNGLGDRADEPPHASVAPVPLLAPWVAVVVVADALPEPGLVLGAQLQAAHPLGALPEVKVGDEQPGRAAVLGLELLAVEGECRPCLAGGDC